MTTPARRVCFVVKRPGESSISMAGFVFARSLASAQRIARQHEAGRGLEVVRDEEWDHYVGFYLHQRRRDLKAWWAERQ
jgi:hypothetical protein